MNKTTSGRFKVWARHVSPKRKSLVKSVSSIASLGLLAFALGSGVTLKAQSNTDGFIYGITQGAAAGSVATAVNLETGLKRDIAIDSAGEFRLSSLPTGRYEVTVKAPGQAEGQTQTVQVNIGGTTVRFGQADKGVVELEKFVVSGANISPINTASVESVTILRVEALSQLPIERNTSAVALLAPGTTQGVNAFGNLISFGGASVAENAYYVNGFNLTNFRNGLGGGSVPFEFYDQFEVKTGGYSAEFGRSTGGVINATTKRGSNTFHGGASIYYEPGRLANVSPSSFLKDGTVYVDRSMDYTDTKNANIFLSGPLWKNHVFLYGLYNVRSNVTEAGSITTFDRSKSDDPFWSGKLDWNITDKHTLEVTAISDRRQTKDEQFVYDYIAKKIGDSQGVTTNKRGGQDYIYRYSGVLTDQLTISALYGKSDSNATDAGAGDNMPFIYDGRSGSLVQLGSATQLQPSEIKDWRKVYRADGEFTFNFAGTHRLRFGYDREDTTSFSLQKYSGPGMGGAYWRYYVTSPGKKIANGAIIPAGVNQYTRLRYYANGGSFSTVSSANYIEDNWKLLDNKLLLNVGVRNDDFNNKNSLGASFIHLKNQIAPRLGASYDPAGNGESKFFVNYGRYFLPVATNTNIRLAGGETFYDEYYVLNNVNADGTPVTGALLGNRVWNSRGDIKDPKTIVNGLIKPMYQDEWILGYQTNVNKQWTVGVRGIYRNLLSTLEDITIDEYLNKYAADNKIAGFEAGGNDYYVLTNPGKPMDVYVDFGDGKGQTLMHITPAQQGYPAATRKYYAVELFFEKLHAKGWTLQGSYTWSHTFGNDEGTVLSDIGQTDNGLTELFDHPGIMDGRYGNLNNDQRHKLKLFGAYEVSSEWQIGANLRISSGTPVLGFGYHPTDAFAAAYGAVSMYINGVPQPRGSLGTTPWTTNLDLSAKYTPTWGKKRVVFGFDLFNALNNQNPTEYVATAEVGGPGQPNPAFGLPTYYQQPRYVRVSASYKF